MYERGTGPDDWEAAARVRNTRKTMNDNTEDKKHDGLPVAGYKPQSEANVALVNQAKQVEENVLRLIDMLQAAPNFDKRWLAIARTNIEQGFMAMNRAVFQPGRLKLPGDAD